MEQRTHSEHNTIYSTLNHERFYNVCIYFTQTIPLLSTTARAIFWVTKALCVTWLGVILHGTTSLLADDVALIDSVVIVFHYDRSVKSLARQMRAHTQLLI